MNLDFSDDQKFLQEEARKFLEKENALLRNRTVLENQSHHGNRRFFRLAREGSRRGPRY